MPQVKIIAKNFMDMVASLPAIKLNLLYRNQFICEAIHRNNETTYKLNSMFQTNLWKHMISGYLKDYTLQWDFAKRIDASKYYCKASNLRG
ncbi:hypothetical protein Goshw_024205, partial [Gossypium schwendimanii]|nr:hypothetical protein [Gossypium schwendimanii]